MPGENFSRRVARAAAVGGGRTYRRQTPYGWWVTLMLICVLGVGLVAYSRWEMQHPLAAASRSRSNLPPTKNNQWKIGLALDLCGRTEYLPASTTQQAFSSDGHGVVTIEPALSANPASYSGKNASLENLLLTSSVLLTPTELQLPGTPPTTTTTTSPSSTTTSTTGSSSTTSTTGSSTTTSTTAPVAKPRLFKNGQSCEGKTGVVQVKRWQSPSARTGTLVTNPSSIRFRNGELITIAFLPKGAPIPRPASAKAIADFLVANPRGLAPAGAAPVTPSTVLPPSVPSSSSATTKTTTSSPSGG